METPPPYQQSDSGQRPQSKISVGMLVAAFDGAWRRFPVTMLFIAYATLWTIVYTLNFEQWFDENAPNLVGGLWYLAGVGVPLTLAISLWCEYLDRPSKWPMTLGLVLLAADFIYILCCGSELGAYWSLSRLSIFTALVVAILFVPSRKVWAWNFTNSQMCAMITATVFSWGVFVAVGLIFMTVFALFNFDEYKVMTCAETVFGFGIPAVIFLHLIPRRNDAEAMEKGFKASKFQCGTAKYFLLLVTVVYMAILYVYGLKILFTWELPRGVVSWSVTGLTMAVLMTLFLLEGVRRTHPDDSLTLRAVKWLPVAMLPLFVLMSVGLLYRIGQYGLTASRLYVLTFNVWCYIVFLYMILSRTRIYSGVAISFAVVFMATSVLPYFNYTTLTDAMMRRNLREALVEMGFSEFPVSEEAFVKAFEALPKERRKDIESKIHYLDEKDDHSKLTDITAAVYYSDDEGSYISDYFIKSYDNDTVVHKPVRIDLEAKTDFVTLPEGYSSVRYKRSHYGRTAMPVGGEVIVSEDVTYSLPIDSLLRLDKDVPFSPVVLRPISGNSDTIYVVRELNVRYDRETWENERELNTLELSGYVFTK